MSEPKKKPQGGPGPRGPRQQIDLKSLDFGAAKRSFGRLMSIVWNKHPKMICIVAVCLVASSLVSVISNAFLQTLIDDYITPFIGSANPDYSGLIKVLIIMACIYLAGIAANYTYNRLMIEVCQGSLKEIRDNMFEHTLHLPIKYYDTHAHGDMMSRFTNDVDTLRQLISQSIPQLLTGVITIVSVLICMLRINVVLTLVVIGLFIFLTRITGTLAGKSSAYFLKQQANLGALNGFIEEMTEGQKVVKVFNHEDDAVADFNRMNDALFESAKNANIFANIMGPVSMNGANMIYVIVALVGGCLAISGVAGALTVGAIVSFLSFVKSISMPINNITQQFGSVIMALAGADRIFNLCDEPVEFDEGYVKLVNCTIDEDGTIHESEKRTGQWAWKHPHKAEGTVTYQKLEGHVQMVDVDFGYVPEKIVLHDVTLYAEPGQKIAFVGSTGAGKTTITNLINRFYDIADGKIRFDGININKINKADLRKSLGMVLQDTNLFTGTVMENIRYGRLEATDEECIAAAKLANAHSFIKHLPDGYNTVLTSNGANLSQGQRQLLSIARAAVANPPVLILDEATSSIDTRTEAIIQDGMDKLMAGRTVFVIAHRLSTVRNSDAIMVLEHGRIIERGTHDDLIKLGGTYYQLYTGKSELS